MEALIGPSAPFLPIAGLILTVIGAPLFGTSRFYSSRDSVIWYGLGWYKIDVRS